MKTKDCIVCQKKIVKTYETNSDWEKRKFCSKKCYFSVPRESWVKEKISASCKERGIGKWMEGRERPIELRKRHSEFMKGVVALGKHNLWKGGVSQTNRTERANFQNTVDYRIWRDAVFKRDNYTCQSCKARNGNGKKIVLNADHIKPYALFPQLRLAIDNGRTLCRDCHYKRHSKEGLPQTSQNAYRN